MTSTASLRRIDGSTSQRVFDTLLRSLAEPGRIVRLPDVVLDMPPVALGPLALADVDVTVAVLGEGAELAGEISRATGARIVAADHADLVIADPNLLGRSLIPEDLDGLDVGSPLAPEDACRVFVAVTALHADPDTSSAAGLGASPGRVIVQLSGPGIAGYRRIGIEGLDAGALGRLGRASGTFPTGIDAWLVTPDGAVVALARSTGVDTDPHADPDQEA